MFNSFASVFTLCTQLIATSLQCLYKHVPSLNKKCHIFNKMCITACTGDCQNDNYQSKHECKFWKNKSSILTNRVSYQNIILTQCQASTVPWPQSTHCSFRFIWIITIMSNEWVAIPPPVWLISMKTSLWGSWHWLLEYKWIILIPMETTAAPEGGAIWVRRGCGEKIKEPAKGMLWHFAHWRYAPRGSCVINSLMVRFFLEALAKLNCCKHIDSWMNLLVRFLKINTQKCLLFIPSICSDNYFVMNVIVAVFTALDDNDSGVNSRTFLEN